MCIVKAGSVYQPLWYIRRHAYVIVVICPHYVEVMIVDEVVKILYIGMIHLFDNRKEATWHRIFD